MRVGVTEAFLRDFRDLAGPLGNKCRELMVELSRVSTGNLRDQALPGWRLHKLKSSPFLSLSLDRNFRVLAKLDGDTLVLHRAVKHDLADRAHVNQNDTATGIAEIKHQELRPSDVHNALLALGVTREMAEPFRTATSDDDLEAALSQASNDVGHLALSLYETSALAIPAARFKLLHRDDTFSEVLAGGGERWRIYLHPSQEFLVKLPVDFRAGVVGSAGTGKTVCAWYRAHHLMTTGHVVGFVCPTPAVLDISKKVLDSLAADVTGRGFYLVPGSADDLIQLAKSVDHLIVDEGQEMPPSWWSELGRLMGDSSLGVSLFYDVNQLGGNIPKGDWRRYGRRLDDWNQILNSFPRLHLMRLSVNYRNSREIAEYYLSQLADSLPTKPVGDLPAFEAGEVLTRRVADSDLLGVLAATLRQLLKESPASEIGVVALSETDRLHGIADQLRKLGLEITQDLGRPGVLVTKPNMIRGHERTAIVALRFGSQQRSERIGRAIDAYVAMSRAIRRLVVLEVA